MGQVMRELIIIFMMLALGPLLVMHDGGIKLDHKLRKHTLEPVKVSSSLSVCRSTLGLLHRCRYAFIDNNDEHIVYRYKIISTPVSYTHLTLPTILLV